MRQKKWIGYLLITPAFLAIFALIIYPVFSAINMSFHKIILIKPQLGRPFIGFENYAKVLSDPNTWNALENTIVWVGVNLFVQMALGMLIAILLNADFRGRALARGAILIPWVTPSVVATLSWRWMYDGEFGIINQILINLGIIEKGVAWLGNIDTAMGAVLVESIWKGTPFVTIMLLAALQAVPKELFDVAKVDGANGLQAFLNVTFPMIKPTFIIASTLTTIYTFNNFNAIWMLTEGGPLRATEILTILVYTKGFREFNIGQANAIGVLTLLILTVFVVIFGRRYIKSQFEW